ncbi:hypothetical protein FRC06_009565 [Ceratobasidium sp. 370]|nr:hypothetical protein FRC06_009565 [Ceratobasidium sp. 370]
MPPSRRTHGQRVDYATLNGAQRHGSKANASKSTTGATRQKKARVITPPVPPQPALPLSAPSAPSEAPPRLTRAPTPHPRAARPTNEPAAQTTGDVEMRDETQTFVPCVIPALITSCDPANACAIDYFRQQLIHEPPIQQDILMFLVQLMNSHPGFFSLFLEKQWTISPNGVMCNSTGFPLTYGHDAITGEDVLYDPMEFPPIFGDPLPNDLGLPFNREAASNSCLNPDALEAERRRLDGLANQFGLFNITETVIPSRRVGGGAAMLARMQAQKASSGSVASMARSPSSSSTTLLPSATIVEAPRTGGPSVHRILTANEQAREGATLRPNPGANVSTDADEDEDEDAEPVSDDENNNADAAATDNAPKSRKPRITDVRPESHQGIVLMACDLYRVLIVNRCAFPNAVERIAMGKEALARAWRAFAMDGEPPELSKLIRQLLNQRIPQVRGDFKSAARGVVVRGVRLDGLTAAEKLAKIHALTSEETFEIHYEHIDAEGKGSGRKFSNPCMVEILLQVMFKGGSSSDGARWFHCFNPISSNLLALLIVSLIVALREHTFGNTRKNVSFADSTFRPIFLGIKRTIDSYKEQRGVRFREITDAILNSCRLAAGLTDDEEPMYNLLLSP